MYNRGSLPWIISAYGDNAALFSKIIRIRIRCIKSLMILHVPVSIPSDYFTPCYSYSYFQLREVTIISYQPWSIVAISLSLANLLAGYGIDSLLCCWVHVWVHITIDYRNSFVLPQTSWVCIAPDNMNNYNINFVSFLSI